MVVSSVGLFNRPNLPDITGIEDFGGAMYHTTAWDREFDYRGKRMALIGTGSTGSQLIQELQVMDPDHVAAGVRVNGNMPWTQNEYHEMIRVADVENYDFRA